ncbi:hypothetical protein [Microvirga lotononidis]|uniref:Uncharacterized protein n=1 Tax=Microvirga lotononidis TaxID=864069 RepID=I4YP33_9HYPH|nr:hypothetical protein [Microvirga lotononidis]EIM25725.1 hypothetical protein MicloDRAFT_00064520 [Microvirga lotononidis]WQO25659.1 hypothetical protein U0023_13125 [Microvirga lotononidis]
MKFTDAELRTLRLIDQHGKAERDMDRHGLYGWRINGEARGQRVDILLQLKALTLSEDKLTATLTDRGRKAISYMKEAA